MCPGPTGIWGSRKYLLGSWTRVWRGCARVRRHLLFASLRSPDPAGETMGAARRRRQAGKARYVGISSYGPRRTEEAIQMLRELGTPVLSISRPTRCFNRWIEQGPPGRARTRGGRLHRVSRLSRRDAHRQVPRGIPRLRVRRGQAFSRTFVTDENVARARGPGRDRAGPRPDARTAGHRLDPARSARDLGAIGASSVGQLEQNGGGLGPSGVRLRRARADRPPWPSMDS